MQRRTITNATGLPEAIVRAVTSDPYSKGNADISITTLLKPMRAVLLERSHETTEDAAERIYSLYGQIVHGILERAGKNTKAALVEKRLFMEEEGVRISGQMDSYDLENECLTDWKFVTAWKFKEGAPPKDWVKQLNLYAELLRRNDFPIKKLEVIGLLRDFSKLEAKRDRDYPQYPIMRLEIPLWSRETTTAFLKERVLAFKSEVLPECTPEERWAKPEVFAVMKEGRKSALRLLCTREKAEAFKESKGGEDLYIEHRPSENVRCENYCAAQPYCEQYKRLTTGPDTRSKEAENTRL